MVIFAIITAKVFIFVCWNYGPSSDTLDTLSERVYNITGRKISTLSFVGGEFFVSTCSSLSTSIQNPNKTFGSGFYHCVTHVGFVLTCCVTMGVCTCNFYSWYKKKLDEKIVSNTTRLQQKKLFLLLILQVKPIINSQENFKTITPLVFSMSPALAVTAFTFFSIDVTDATNYILSFMLTITQLMDPIWIFAFITDYRDALFCRNKESYQNATYVTENIMPNAQQRQ